MSHDHYKKDVRHLDMIDVYRVIELFEVTHPALQHALKKVLCAGDRGAKDWERDVREAVDSLHRALQMRAEDAGAKLTEEQQLLLSDPVAYVQKHVEAQTKNMPNDPHAELRKTWKPGQRWQWKYPWGPLSDWYDLDVICKPAWVDNIEYRRHPDDAKEGGNNG
jgi:hypothetical protein